MTAPFADGRPLCRGLAPPRRAAPPPARPRAAPARARARLPDPTDTALPAATRARLNSHQFFGCLAEAPFQDVLAFVDRLGRL